MAWQHAQKVQNQGWDKVGVSTAGNTFDSLWIWFFLIHFWSHVFRRLSFRFFFSLSLHSVTWPCITFRIATHSLRTCILVEDLILNRISECIATAGSCRYLVSQLRFHTLAGLLFLLWDGLTLCSGWSWTPWLKWSSDHSFLSAKTHHCLCLAFSGPGS